MRYAFRTLLAAPLMSASVVLALALGVGANAAVFSVIQKTLLTPLPFEQPDRLVRVWEAKSAQGIADGGLSPGTFVDLRARTQTLEATGIIVTPREWLYRFGDESELLRRAAVSPDLFRLLGVQPVTGRAFRPERDQLPPFGDSGEVVISFGLWQRRFGGREDVLGSSLTTEAGVQSRIIGIMPRGFSFPARADVWVQETFLRPVGLNQRQVRYYEAVARVRDGVHLEKVHAELAAIGAQLALEYPTASAGWELRTEALAESRVATVRQPLLLLFGAVGCVLLIACANVAALILARAAARRHDIALRVALGATTRDFVRQWLAESAILATLSGGFGMLSASVLTRLFVAAAPAELPGVGDTGGSVAVLLFAFAIAILVSLLTGLPPLLLALRSSAQEAMKQTERGMAGHGRSVGTWLVAAQVALTVVLLVSATMLVRSFVALRAVDLGFTVAHALAVDLRVPLDRFPKPSRRPWFHLARHYEQVIDTLESVPGVAAVGGITGLPLTTQGAAGTFWKKEAAGAADGRPPASASDQWKTTVSIVTPGYFGAMQMPLLRGRGFARGDRLSELELTDPSIPKREGVAIVNEAMANEHWRGEDPTGRSIVLFEDESFVVSRRIVGVVRDMRSVSIADAPKPTIFIPFAEHPGFRLALAVRTHTVPERLAEPVRDSIRTFDPRLFIGRIETLDTVVSRALSIPRFNLLLVTTFAAVSLVLAVLGIAGVVGYAVSRRTREIGLRMALGATRRDVVHLVLREGLPPVLAGCVAGTAAALAIGQAIRALLFGVQPWDPISLMAAPAVLLAAALVAMSVPASRALRVDPLASLRAE